MKKSFLTFLTIAFGINAVAQITISHYDMPLAGNVFKYNITLDLVAEDFTQTGPNFSWDYSTATANTNDTLTIVKVNTTPFAYQLYFNNPFQYANYVSNYAVAGQDINAFGQVSISDRFNYYKVNGNSLEITGFGANVNGIPASVKYDTIDQIYPFLMSYNMATHNSRGYYLLTVPTFGTYGQWIRREVEADGWGELITPNETYPNTLRVKTTLYQRDTVFIDQFSIGQSINRPVETKYEWFTNTDNAPVMSVTVTGGQNTNVKYLAPIAANVAEISSTILINPTVIEGVYALVNKTNIPLRNVQVFDVSGRQVTSGGNLKTIDLSMEKSGIYIVKLILQNNSTVTQKIKR